MIEVILPRDRRYCGTLSLRGAGGDAVFGPVPTAASSTVQAGQYDVRRIYADKGVVTLEAPVLFAIAAQAPSSAEDLSINEHGLRLLHRDMQLLIELLDLYGKMPCVVRRGVATSVRATHAAVPGDFVADAHLRRLALAASIAPCR